MVKIRFYKSNGIYVAIYRYETKNLTLRGLDL
jgi:hypothetical protein